MFRTHLNMLNVKNWLFGLKILIGDGNSKFGDF